MAGLYCRFKHYFGGITLIAYLDQRRSTKMQSEIYDDIKLFTKMSKSKEEIEHLMMQRQQIEDQIENRLPLLARFAVLRQEASTHADAAAKHYSEWKKIITELKEIPQNALIDQKIESAIVEKMIPDYEKRAARDALRDRITVYSIALVLLNSIIPFIGLILFIPIASDLLKLLNISSDKLVLQKTIKEAARLGILAIGISCTFLGSIIFLTGNGWQIGLFVGTSGFIIIIAWYFMQSRINHFLGIPGDR